MPSVPMCTSSPISPLPTTSSEILLSGPHPQRRCHNYFLGDTHSSESELEFSLLSSPLEDVDRVFNCRLTKTSEENSIIIDANLQPAVQLKSMGKWLPELNLNIQDREMLLNSSQWLTDMHINAAQKLLKRLNPTMPGLENVLFSYKYEFEEQQGEFLQILYTENH